MESKKIKLSIDLALENGGVLRHPTIAYHTRGTRNADGSNVVWVCHALTANSDFEEWWSGLFTNGGYFDDPNLFIIAANAIGSCYGSTGPLSTDPVSGTPYYYTFPKLTINDLVAAHQALAAELGIDKIACLIGGSLGGQQALQWAVNEPARFEYLVAIATNAVHSPWGIAFNESQRMAVELDPTWGDLSPKAGEDGMKVARSLALLSYRNYGTYARTQTRNANEPLWKWKAGSYQIYQGEKLAKRFRAQSYVVLSHAMDSHDLGRSHPSGEAKQALAIIQAKTLIISLEDDLLFPAEEQLFLAKHIANAEQKLVNSIYGHDGFLIETDALSHLLESFIQIKSSFKKSLKSTLIS